MIIFSHSIYDKLSTELKPLAKEIAKALTCVKFDFENDLNSLIIEQKYSINEIVTLVDSVRFTKDEIKELLLNMNLKEEIAKAKSLESKNHDFDNIKFICFLDFAFALEYYK